MEKYKINIATYSNLPSGGALELAQQNLHFLKRHFSIQYLSDSQIKPKNLLDYLCICIFKLPRVHQSLASEIPNTTTVLVAYHSWLTKSPYILRCTHIPKIYICQEVMREYYDNSHKRIQSWKERIINIIRLPIKYIDKENLKSPNLTVVANSLFAKSLIDKSYGVVSKIIYPGIDTSLFREKSKVEKNNQVISVGAINKLKGYEFLLRVISKINQEIRPTLVIVGNGTDQEYVTNLRRMAKEINVKLKIKVNITKSELINEYLKSKLFLYAPVNEPFGIVVEEAMAAKLPLVVYEKGGGYVEILTNKNGLLLDNLNPENWARKTENLLRNKKMQDEYGKYNIKYVVEKYDSKIMNNNLLTLIKSL